VSERDSRRALIRQVLEEEHVSSQDQLMRLLAEHGVVTTQATVSRDLRDLGITRSMTSRGPRYRVDQRARYMRALMAVVGMEIVDIRHNGSLVVVRTLAGRAEGVAALLDSRDDFDILGTVAGDDTVFIAPTDPNKCDDLVAAIRALTEGSWENT
jgi:transcriptional regulator of arginine metabolism